MNVFALEECAEQMKPFCYQRPFCECTNFLRVEEKLVHFFYQRKSGAWTMKLGLSGFISWKKNHFQILAESALNHQAWLGRNKT